FFFSSRRRHTRSKRDWSSDVCSSDLGHLAEYIPPDVYDEKFSRWNYEDLPIIPEEWKLAVSGEKKDQFYVLKRLLNRPDIQYVRSEERRVGKEWRWMELREYRTKHNR